MTGHSKRRFLNRFIFSIFGILLLLPFLSQGSNPISRTDTTYRRNPGTVSPKGPYRPARTKKSEIIYTRLDVQFDWVKQQVPASAVLKFKPHFYPQNTLELDAKGFDIKAVVMLDTVGDYGFL